MRPSQLYTGKNCTSKIVVFILVQGSGVYTLLSRTKWLWTRVETIHAGCAYHIHVHLNKIPVLNINVI